MTCLNETDRIIIEWEQQRTLEKEIEELINEEINRKPTQGSKKSPAD